MLREEEFLPDASRDEFIYNVKLQDDRIREPGQCVPCLS